MARLVLFALLALAVVVPMPAASLVGDTVNLDWVYPSVGSYFAQSSVVVVSPNAEMVCPGGNPLCSGYGAVPVSVNIEALSVRHEYYALGNYAGDPFNGIEVSDLDFGGGETILSVGLTTNIAGLHLGLVQFGADFARINLSGLTVTDGSFWEMTFETDGGVVPEPSTWLLVGAGLGIAGWLRRRA